MSFRALALTLASSAALAACTSFKPPQISYDDPPERAVLQANPPKPVRIVEIPKLLPLPGQLKRWPNPGKTQPPQPKDPKLRVKQANAAARVQPSRDDYLNAIQVYPFSVGALYQVYCAPGRITDIALQPGENLVGSGPVAAGDTVRWIIGDTQSGTGPSSIVHVLVKPIRKNLVTNLVINTDRRTYHMELRSTQNTYMASVRWIYAQDQLIALRRQNEQARAAQPIATGVNVDNLHFRYRIFGSPAPWRPVRAFDDGRHVYIEFPRAIGQGRMPPLFVTGARGHGELVNYRVRGNEMIVDRLFAAAELRLGSGKHQRLVRIVRTDGRPVR